MLPVPGCPLVSTLHRPMPHPPHHQPTHVPRLLGPGTMITPSLLQHEGLIIVTIINIVDVTQCHTSHYCDQSVTGAGAPGHPGVCHYPGSWVMMRSSPHIWAVIPMVQLPGYQMSHLKVCCVRTRPSDSDTVHSTAQPVQCSITQYRHPCLV